MSLSFRFLLIVLLFTSISVIQIRSSETVKLKVTLNRREDGHVHASIFIGNVTRSIMEKISLQLDINAVMDNSRLIGAQGFVRDTKRKDTVELSNCNNALKEEESKEPWLNYCPQKGEEQLKTVSRIEWGRKENVSSERRTQTADLLIAGVHRKFAYIGNYYVRMLGLYTYETASFGGLLFNFVIADDGTIFEGIGWNRFNYIFNDGLGQRSLIIRFMKGNRHSEPSAAAIKAFNELVKSAICKKELSLKYSLIPYYLINDDYSLGDDSFERKEMKTWHSYINDLDFLVPWERVIERIIDPQIIPKEKWRITKTKEELMTLSSPIEYIAISQIYARCFFNCTKYLNVLERYYGIYFNFLLSEEGRVYEVMGWEETWERDFQKRKVLIVGFMGRFNSYGPSKPMFLALNALILDGLRSGKLSTHYNIVTIKKDYPFYYYYSGDFLENEIKKLDRYTEKY